MIDLPARQVHLDFHTSELIPDVGRDFEKAQFQAALRVGRIGSINIFAKCHHGWSYYPTTVGHMHPTLTRDLLGEQIAACHEIGVRAPIYFTVGWSVHDAETHPEWVGRTIGGEPHNVNINPDALPTDPRPGCSWQTLCPNGGYLELILAQTREICARYPVDGFWYDICFGGICYCDSCRAGMATAGLDAEDAAHAREYYVRKWQHFQQSTREIILGSHPDALLYHNSGASQYTPEWHEAMTHFELEDLPTTWGGYDKFPIRARYFANSGKQYIAMSGKFHTSWGEFGGFKDPDAIRYEAACMIAYGARVNFGDQLHPSGVMDMATYENLGAGLAYIEEIEAYGLDSKPYANLALWLSGSEAHDQGTANMLLETQTDFEIAIPGQPLSRYDAIVLPGFANLSDASAAALSQYVREGGALLVIGEGGLDREKTLFLLEVGANYLGPAAYADDYLVVGEQVNTQMVASPVLCYSAALRAELCGGEALAAIKEPYFDRTYAHYCSHQNTPNQLDNAAHPAAWRHGNIVYLAHPVDAMYYQHGARLHRQYFANALALIYRQRVLTAPLPSAGRATLAHQPQHRRYVAHLLYGPPLQRGRCLVIEDLVPLSNIPVTLAVPEAIRRVSLAPGGEMLPMSHQNGGVQVTVPQFRMHQAVVFEY